MKLLNGQKLLKPQALKWSNPQTEPLSHYTANDLMEIKNGPRPVFYFYYTIHCM